MSWWRRAASRRRRRSSGSACGPAPPSKPPLSELVRKHGLRRHRYRGEAKRHFENLLKGAACNLKRLVRALVARGERDAAASARTGGRVPGVAAPPLAA